MKTGDTDLIYKNELDKASFQHDMTYDKSKDLVKRTRSDKVLRYKAFKIASDRKCNGYQRGLASMVYKFFDKKYSGSGITNVSNYQLANELRKPIIKKFKKRKVYSSFRDNIWGVDLADMQSLSKNNEGVKYLLCAIDLFNKYAWVIPTKDKKGTSIINALQKIISNGRKPNKIWLDQGSEFYSQSFKEFLKINRMYSAFNERKSVVAKIFIRTLKNKIFKHMTAISKNVYFDVLDDMKMKPIEVTDDSYAEYKKYFNKKDPKFKVGDHVRISKHENIFAKGCVPNWSEEIFVASKIKNTVP